MRTLGPWKIMDIDAGRWHEKQFGSGRFCIIAAEGEELRPSLAAAYHEADAHLIAAAPELLVACQALLKWCATKPLAESYLAFANIKALAELAIAKAEGREP